MEIKIKYSVLFTNGKKSFIFQNHTCPDFKNKKKPLTLITGQTFDFETSIEEQVDDWVLDLDKTQFMYENDIEIIFDWIILSKNLNNKIELKQKKLPQSEMVGLFIKEANMTEDLKTEFIAVYSNIKSSIKDLKFDKQIDITLKSLNVAMMASSEAYKSQIKILKDGLSVYEKKISYGKTNYIKIQNQETKKITNS